MKYHLTYDSKAHPEGIEASEVPKGQGACTAMMFGSLLYPPDGSYSAAFFSRDGRTDAPLDDAELWKAWAMLAWHLSQSETLSPGKKEVVTMVHEIIANILRGSRADEEKKK